MSEPAQPVQQTASPATSEKQEWQTTKIPNLFALNGHYYLRIKPKGQPQLRESLHTQNFHIAKARMRERLLELGIDGEKEPLQGTWGALIEPYKAWLQGKVSAGDIAIGTVGYKEEILEDIGKTWTGFLTERLDRCSEKSLAEWRSRHRGKYSATRTNGAITVLRELAQTAIREKVCDKDWWKAREDGLNFVKVKYDYKRMTLELPEPHQVTALRLICRNGSSV
jgi:hypothetical protein